VIIHACCTHTQTSSTCIKRGDGILQCHPRTFCWETAACMALSGASRDVCMQPPAPPHTHLVHEVRVLGRRKEVGWLPALHGLFEQRVDLAREWGQRFVGSWVKGSSRPDVNDESRVSLSPRAAKPTPRQRAARSNPRVQALL